MCLLMCAEKPDQAKKIAAPFPHIINKDHIAIHPCEILPKGAIVINACGHLMELCSPGDYDTKLKDWSLETLPIIPKQFKLKVIESKRFYFNTFKKFLNEQKITTVVNCGDPGVEGCLLIDEILYFLNNKKPVKRLWTTSLTKESVIKACQNLRDNKEYRGYYNAGLARQRGDWLVGISSSRALTLLLGQKGINKVFSAGRVQSSLMGLIYQREKDIENFVSQPFWDCLAEFQFGEYKLEGKWFNETAEHIFDQDAAQALAEYCKSCNEAQVYSVIKEEKRIRPPHFYNLSGLQMEANRLYGMSPSSVLNFAQALYDKSYITYPRSDSTHLTPEEAKWLPTILGNLSKIEEYQPLIKGATRDLSNDKRYVDASKVSDHYGIVLTEELVNPLHLPKGEQQIYDLIAKSIIAAHYPDFVYDSSEIVVTVKHRFSFKSKGKQIKDEGWKAVFSKEKTAESEDDNDVMLPPLNEGEIGMIASIELKEGATTALPRFSQGDLIKIMANAGHYCQNKEDFKNSELKLGTEATRANIVSTITSRYVAIHKNLVYLQPEGRILIEALGQDNYLTSVITTGRMERYLENIKNGKGTVEEFTKGIETVTKRVVEKLLADAPIWDFNKYIQEIQESEVIGKCKICGADVLEHTNFFGCSAYKENNCEFKIPKKILGKAISKENAVKLLKTGTTSLIKGFKPKDKDSTFDAFLVWSENNKSINFRYK